MRKLVPLPADIFGDTIDEELTYLRKLKFALSENSLFAEEYELAVKKRIRAENFNPYG